MIQYICMYVTITVCKPWPHNNSLNVRSLNCAYVSSMIWNFIYDGQISLPMCRALMNDLKHTVCQQTTGDFIQLLSFSCIAWYILKSFGGCLRLLSFSGQILSINVTLCWMFLHLGRLVAIAFNAMFCFCLFD